MEGRGRPCGNRVDVGAYESGGCNGPPPFARGDTNEDETFDLSDPVALLAFLFLGTVTLDCLDAADMDDSGELELTDAVFGLLHLFLGGSPPPSPFPECGTELWLDELPCTAHGPCA